MCLTVQQTNKSGGCKSNSDSNSYTLLMREGIEKILYCTEMLFQSQILSNVESDQHESDINSYTLLMKEEIKDFRLY